MGRILESPSLRRGLLLCMVLIGSAAGRQQLPGDLAEWSTGPIHWLLQSDEAHQYHRLETADEARAFIQAFWERRNPAPGDPLNSYARDFFDRVAIADKLYAEEDLPGSLTERGGALILLGPPSILRVFRRKIPALEANRPGRTGEMQEIPIEIWAYRREDVPDLVRAEPAIGESEEIALTFQLSGKHATLLDGRGVLRLAAKAAIRRP
ncbi:MAG: GWxTD domain-containing protein [Acidobacteriota bacterium]